MIADVNNHGQRTEQNTWVVNEAICINERSIERTCSVCGLSEWCGTDGCPYDPT